MLKENKRLQRAQEQQVNRKEDLEKGRIRIEPVEKRQDDQSSRDAQKKAAAG